MGQLKDGKREIGYVAGIDVGSLSTDVVILDAENRVAGSSITRTGASSIRSAEKAMEEALGAAGLQHKDLSFIVSTGYGRKNTPFTDLAVTEITCHARGAWFLFPGTGTVVDVGGQDSKVIHVGAGGKVLDFTMNDKCAAGTGRFLEVMAEKLQVGLERMGALSVRSRGEVAISSVCTVFAESEVVSLVARDHPPEEIVRGIHRAIVGRIWTMVRSLGVRGELTMSGGVAKNPGVVSMLEEKLGRAVLVPPEPQAVGALGAALIARERANEIFLKP
jgi:(R)-2-hydroxyacyl-CoA dehydratese activating ATPase